LRQKKIQPMKLNIILSFALLVTTLSVFAQNTEGQYSLEGAYGIGQSGKPSLTGSHYNFGVRYMFDEYWGIKADFGHDKYRTDLTPETGVNYTRISLQAVENLGRTLGVPDVTAGYINILAHGGIGYSHSKSTVSINDDNMANVIIGLTPQIYLFKNLALQFDASYVVNLSQHFDYDGYYRFKGAPKSFTGSQLNASVGLILYLGKRESDFDWR